MNCTGLGLDLSRILSTMSLICFARTSPYWVVQPPWLSLALYSMTPTENWAAMAPDTGPADDSANSASAAVETFDDALTKVHMMQPPIVIVKNRRRKLVARFHSVKL